MSQSEQKWCGDEKGKKTQGRSPRQGAHQKNDQERRSQEKEKIIEVDRTTYRKNNRTFTYGYYDVPSDCGEWVDATKYVPRRFDLVQIDIGTPRKIWAWWTGTEWFGMRLKITDKVIAWKKTAHQTLR